MNSQITSLVIVLSLTLGGHRAMAQDFAESGPCDSMHALHYGPATGDCAKCGCRGVCKICRLVREDRKLTTVCWGIKDEDFCVPCPSRPGCEHCESVCASCQGKDTPSAKAKKLVWTDWIPGDSAKLFTRHRLMKKTVTKSVPSFKWVVEDLCPDCQANCEPVEVPTDTKIPPPPSRP